MVCDVLELSLVDNPLRRIVPKGPSQNVVAVVPPSAEHRQDLVLIGHIDTARTPVIFSTPRWIAIYKAFIAVGWRMAPAIIRNGSTPASWSST